MQGFLGDPQHRRLLAGRQGAHADRLEGHRGGVGAVQHLDLGGEGGDQAVLLQRGRAQLDDHGPKFVGGLGGEPGDLGELGAGPGRVALDQGGGGLGGQPQ